MGCFSSKSAPESGEGNSSSAARSADPKTAARSGDPPVSSSLKELKASLTGKPNSNIHDKYTVEKELGRGAFGVATLVKDKSTGESFACKTISKAKINTPQEASDIKKEIDILTKLKGHPGVVTIHETFEDHDDVHMILELCSGGELFDRIIAKGTFSEKDAAHLTRVMLETIKHCHDNGVCHRDLKPENFLYDSPEEDANLKVTDFGLSCFFTKGQILTDRVGTPYYVAPEVIIGRYNEKSDVFSIGSILYILLCGSPAFYGETDEDILRATLDADPNMESLHPWPMISNEAREVVKMMLEKSPKRRASVQQCLEHPWIKKDGIASAKPLVDSVVNNMAKFNNMNKLKKRALVIMASNMNENEIAELKRQFELMDADHSGSITVEELKSGLTKVKPDLSQQEIQALMKTYDVDGDGTISYEEFIAATAAAAKINTQENMAKAFKEFDKDGDGSITVEEVLDALKDMGVDMVKAQQIVKDADRDGDGCIDYDEFIIMMNSNDSPDGPKTVKNPLSFMNTEKLTKQQDEMEKKYTLE